MGFKKIMLVLIFTLAILTIGSVSAADDNETSLTVDEDLILESSNDEVLSTDEGIFSDLSALIESTPENGTLELDKDYINNGSESEISISKAITIDGKGHTLDAEKESRVFNIASDEVTLKNIVFKNGHYDDNGGTIYWIGDNGVLSNCSFVNCYANSITEINGAVGGSGDNCSFISCRFMNCSGGAICWGINDNYGKKGVVVDCSFVNCSSRIGGAIYLYGSEWIVNNCNFTDCTAREASGGIYWYGANGILSDCSFVNCSTEYNVGGAINWYQENGAIVNCSFLMCSASRWGGAICWHYREGNISNCTFIKNTAGEGGSIYGQLCNVSVSECIFIKNTAGDGGAIYGDSSVSNCSFINNSAENGGAIYEGGSQRTVSDCSFVNNSARDGGAVRWAGDKGILFNCSFVNNTVSHQGGAIYWMVTNGGTIFDCSFVNNAANRGDSYGGAIFLSASDGSISNCSFINNSATLMGGAIHWYYNNNGSVSNCTFADNSAKTGGALEWSYGVNDSISNCRFLKNTADEGGAIHGQSSYSSVFNCSFTENAAVLTGGAIDCDCSVFNSTFENNRAGEGGAIYERGSYRTVSESSFVNNSASDGGAVYWVGGNGKIEDSNFTLSQAKNGGAVYVDKDIILNVSNSKFENNVADELGGAIYFNFLGNVDDCTFDGNGEPEIYADFDPSGSTFANIQFLIDNASEGDVLELDKDYQNTGDESQITISKSITIDGKGHTLDANNKSGIFRNTDVANVILRNIVFKNGYDDNGGAIYWGATNGTVLNCSFINCSSKWGGAIDGYGYNTVVSGCSFISCYGVSGGAIFWGADNRRGDNGIISNCSFLNCSSNSVSAINFNDCKDWTVTSCNFTNCYSENTGAVFFGYGANGIASYCNFVNCSSNQNCGALEMMCTNGIVFNCSFINCSAGAKGGAIYWLYYEGSISNCTFINNTVSQSAGAVYGQGCHIYISNSIFAENTASNGGAIACDCTVSNCTFENNVAFESGGAIYQLGSHRSFLNSRFVNNTAANGGAIYWSGSNGTVSSCSFVKNTAKNNGGSIYWSGSDGKIDDSNFTLSQAKNGGAIYGTGENNVTIFGSKFENNTAEESDDAIYGGSVSNCTFIGNDDPTVANINTTTILEINSAEVHVGEDIPIKITVLNPKNETVRGAVDFYVNGILNRTIQINELFAYSPPTSGNYTFEARFNGTRTYLKSENSRNVYVSKLDSPITIAVGEIRYGETAIVNVSIPAEATGNVTVAVDGKTYCCVLEDGFAGVAIANLSAGNYTIKVSYGGNDNFLENSTDGHLEVMTIDSVVVVEDVSLDYGESINITVITQGAVGFTAKINENKVEVEGDNVIIPILDAGNYTLSVTVIPDKNHNSVVKTACITVNKIIPDVAVNAADIVFGETERIRVMLPADAMGNVSFSLFKANKLISNSTSTVIGGIAEYEYSKLNMDVYGIDIQYGGDLNYEKASKTSKFTVRPVVVISQNVTVGDNVGIEMDLAGAEGTIVTLIDGKPKAIEEINNGKVDYSFSTENMTARNHTVTFEYYGNSFDRNVFNCFDNQTNAYVPMEYGIYLAPKDVEIPDEVESDGGIIILEFEENATGTVEAFVNGVSIQIVDIVNGLARIDLSNYVDGDYTFTFEYSGDENYEGFLKNVTVHHKLAKIKANNLKVLYSAGSKYSVTVYDNEGNVAKNVQVIFKINDKQVAIVKTDSKGVATYKVTNAPGTYNITAISLGAEATKTLTVKHLVTLKKVTVKRSAKKLVLTATLAKVNKKYLKNKKVTFKFNGKKYTAKTNKKGVAKVTIKSSVLKKLKAGKKITYQATYLKDTVKQNVKVKK